MPQLLRQIVPSVSAAMVGTPVAAGSVLAMRLLDPGAPLDDPAPSPRLAIASNRKVVQPVLRPEPIAPAHAGLPAPDCRRGEIDRPPGPPQAHPAAHLRHKHLRDHG